MRRHREPGTSPPCKRRLNMDMLSVRPVGEGASQAGVSAVSLKKDDPKDTGMPVLGIMLNKPSLNPEVISTIKHQILKDIQQYRQKYEKITFKSLEGILGPPELRKQFVEFAIKEATRFKRQDLIKHLENEKKIESDEFLSKDKQSPNI
ncbi:integrator complex subunit 6-like [Suricata suricatta]|uniref:integrator complex subunit 6-like n=1 Tax=Suricata suricatta TaxID=37032 RepID=UPI00115531EC|nr:integrator complex subunit 6-like [Suricata suricatta]